MGDKKLKVKKNLFQKFNQFIKHTIQRFQGIDRITLILVAVLFSIGLLMIYSITSISIYNGAEGDPIHYLKKTLINAIIGIAGMIFVLLIPYRGLKKMSLISVFACPLILILTLLFGKGSGVSNVKSWFDIGPLRIQPAEFVKVGMILSMAWMISKRIDKGTYYFKSWKLLNGRLLYDSYVPIVGYFGVCTVLVFVQPDFGSALILGSIGLIAFLSTGIKWKSLWPIVVLGLIGVGLIVIKKLGNSDSYQVERLAIWLDPFNQPDGFQSVMGYTAIALGGMTGVGIGNSTQKYGYVLEPHNDMISTIIAEELGVWVILLIMLIYFVIATRCFFTALKSKDIYASIVCIGIGAIFLVQPVVNLGGASGAIPLTGVTLPFISYGGSSIMSLFIAIGVYCNVRMEIIAQQKRLKKKREESVKLKVVPFPKS